MIKVKEFKEGEKVFEGYIGREIKKFVPIPTLLLTSIVPLCF